LDQTPETHITRIFPRLFATAVLETHSLYPEGTGFDSRQGGRLP